MAQYHLRRLDDESWEDYEERVQDIAAECRMDGHIQFFMDYFEAEARALQRRAMAEPYGSDAVEPLRSGAKALFETLSKFRKKMASKERQEEAERQAELDQLDTERSRESSARRARALRGRTQARGSMAVSGG